MMNTQFFKTGMAVLCAFGISAVVNAANPGAILYKNDFEKVAEGSVPDDFLVLDGAFAVKELDGNKFLELPGAPLETFGVLFGPTERENLVVSARMHGTNKGRRFPTFALGLGGQGGYRLRLAPAKKAVELYKGDSLKLSVPYDWESGKWTHLKLQVWKTGDQAWSIGGKVWLDGQSEPSGWTIATEETVSLTSGRASIWGSPYAGTPIRFDDLVISSVAP